MKGTTWYFVILSIIGVLVGLAMIFTGWSGNSLSPILVLILGVFIVFKEILDIFH